MVVYLNACCLLLEYLLSEKSDHGGSDGIKLYAILIDTHGVIGYLIWTTDGGYS
jgi:hypothetical protein